jgi:hypothetical protein
MIINLPTNKSSFVVSVVIKTNAAENICIVAKDQNRPSTFYFRRKGVVNGKRNFILRFPVSPNMMELKIYNDKNGCAPRDEDMSFKVIDMKISGLEKKDIWMNEDTTEFVKFATFFAENASILSLGEYGSEKGRFKIQYLKEIPDNSITPARIGHENGLIEVSKDYFIHYSVPMRMIILLHEYSHKYLNHLVNKKIDDEVSADVNALYIYLGLGYPRIEATNAYLTVFANAANKGNNKRYKIIEDFIQKFDQGKFN